MDNRQQNYLMNAVLMAVVFLAVISASARLLDMTLDEVALDIIAGAIGGLAVLALIIWNNPKMPSPAPTGQGDAS